MDFCEDKYSVSHVFVSGHMDNQEKRGVENTFGITSIMSALCLLQFDIRGVEILMDF